MAIVVEGRLLITDASNVPISGGKARIYNTGTTTLSDLFSDAALVTPLTNPVVANSSGFTPVIFGAEGLTVDITYLTSADATVTGRTYTAVPLVGADNGVFSRTLADNTRVKITGAGGIVLFQVGDASPDDVGGNLTIEGWAGTQGTLATLDFATVNTTGRYTEIGKKIVGTVYTEATPFTAVTEVDMPLTADPTGVRAWEVYVFDIMPSADINMSLRLSYDGGATYKATADDYEIGHIYHNDTTPVSFSDYTVSTGINLRTPFRLVANQPAFLRFTVITPPSGADATLVVGETFTNGNTGTIMPQRGIFGAHAKGGYGKATNARLYLTSAGTVTGKYRVVPLRGFGE